MGFEEQATAPALAEEIVASPTPRRERTTVPSPGPCAPFDESE